MELTRITIVPEASTRGASLRVSGTRGPWRPGQRLRSADGSLAALLSVGPRPRASLIKLVRGLTQRLGSVPVGPDQPRRARELSIGRRSLRNGESVLLRGLGQLPQPARRDSMRKTSDGPRQLE
jgi:hypothetical protein